MALNVNMQRVGQGPVSGSPFGTLGLKASGVVQPAPKEIARTGARQGGTFGLAAGGDEAPVAVSLFDSLALEANMAARQPQRRVQPFSSERVGARLALRAAAARTAHVVQNKRDTAAPAGKTPSPADLAPTRPASKVLFDALALDGGRCPAPRRCTGGRAAASATATAGHGTRPSLSELVAKAPLPRFQAQAQADAQASKVVFDRIFSEDSTVASSAGSHPSSEIATPMQTEEHLPLVHISL